MTAAMALLLIKIDLKVAADGSFAKLLLTEALRTQKLLRKLWQ